MIAPTADNTDRIARSGRFKAIRADVIFLFGGFHVDMVGFPTLLLVYPPFHRFFALKSGCK
jgi:hypothetical protein